MRVEDVNQGSIRCDDTPFVLANGNEGDAETYVKYVKVDNLVTRTETCVGSSRILGINVIKRYKSDIDFETRPANPILLNTLASQISHV